MCTVINNIPEYNRDNFFTIYGEHSITTFNHGSMASGPVDENQVKKIVEILNKKTIEITKVIDFKEDLIVKRLEGGSCSSIVFQISLVALRCLKSTNEAPKLREIVKNSVNDINKSSKSGRQSIRNIQAAFNTISINTAEKVDKISQEKIKALVTYFDLKIVDSTEECLILETEEDKNSFSETINKLQNGVYLIRVIKKADNHKLEVQGHSTLYIKNSAEELYFDTQLGLYKINGAKDIIYTSICSAKRRFEIDCCTFYQLSI